MEGFVGKVVISKCNHLPNGREENEKKKQIKKKKRERENQKEYNSNTMIWRRWLI